MTSYADGKAVADADYVFYCGAAPPPLLPSAAAAPATLHLTLTPHPPRPSQATPAPLRARQSAWPSTTPPRTSPARPLAASAAR
jgi:hypothetical protein